LDKENLLLFVCCQTRFLGVALSKLSAGATVNLAGNKDASRFSKLDLEVIHTSKIVKSKMR